MTAVAGGQEACCADCAVEAPRPTRAWGQGVATCTALALATSALLAGQMAGRAWWRPALFAGAALVGGAFPARRAVTALGLGRLDINALMVIAVAGALAIEQWEEAAVVVLLFSAAQWLEARSLDRARRAIGRLLDLAPAEAIVREGVEETRVPLDRVRPGALVIVRPGDRIAVDGIVRGGRSDVNQAPITGESLPIEKSPGDEVFAGTINGHGAIEVEVTRRGDDTTLARIVHLVESARAQRAPVQQFIDRFAAWYTPAVVAGAALLAGAPAMLGEPFDVWLYRALVLLVVACPCALVISTPVSIVSALSAAARHGVLVKGGVHLERLASVRAAAFDKTGTVTTGELRVAAIDASGADADEVVALAGAVESRSEHPVAAAVVREARRRGLHIEAPERVRALPGLGVEGQVSGATVLCGGPRLFVDGSWLTERWSNASAAMVDRGLSPILVARDGAIVGAIGIEETSRGEAAAVVRALRREGVRHVALLTGDHDRPARAAGEAAGIADVRSGLLPGDKVDAVHALRRDHGPILMVGDGINDAPALAAADVGVVMGAIGSDAALETADIALMGDDLAKLPWALRLSRATLANIRANVAIALGLKAVFVALAAAGIATLWMAVLADTGASLLVVANALRLRRLSPS